mmetsp:Transcript_117765/g.203833  ORF Transcript_117765/g.203833 Transcript_117765/m.203833 type:complete len:770 (-) Transcript_117765:47-2356(-)
MEPLRVACVIALLFVLTPLVHSQNRPTYKEYKTGLEAEANTTKAATAKQKKMSAVDKVIELMKSLTAKVVAEGNDEAKTYNEFACFCKTTQKEKTESIQEGEDSSASLSSEIESLASHRDTLDSTIASLIQNIKTNEKQMAEETEKRHETNKVYAVDEADLSAAISALEGAINAMKASKTGAASLVQVQSLQKTLQTAMLLADSLGLIPAKHREIAALFLQNGAAQPPPEVEMESYKFHSDSIIETLETLLKSFTAKKIEVDKEEVKSVKNYDVFMQEKTDLVQDLNNDLDMSKQKREEKIAAIQKASTELSIVSATLLDDKEYLAELNKICSDKAKTWDQRSRVRMDELSALNAAQQILKSTVTEKTRAATVRLTQKGPATIYFGMRYAQATADNEDAMDALEAETEAIENGQTAPVAFLQRRAMESSLRSHTVGSPGAAEAAAREAVVALLRKKGEKLKSTLLTSLATDIGKDEDPFAKIKTLIQQLIDKLLLEETSESNQKGWCDKEISDNSQKRDYASEKVMDLNAKMEKLEALRDKLDEAVSLLSEQIAELEKNRATAVSERAKESEENKITVEEAKVGLEAINNATDIIFKFYATAAKESVNLSLAQGPMDDAPDAGFKNGEAYIASQGEASGILGMMDVIKSDFERTISETIAAEAQAVNDHLAFMTETGKSLQEKSVAKTEKKKLFDEAVVDLGSASDSLDAQMQIVVAGIKELMTLKETCIDTGMSYAERKENREEEIEALHKALCILGNYMDPSAVEAC